MIDEEVHAYMARTGTSIAELEDIALAAMSSYETERACVEPRKVFSLAKKQKQKGAIPPVWLKLAIMLHEEEADPREWMIAAFSCASPYPYISALTSNKYRRAYKARVKNPDDRAVRTLAMWYADLLEVMRKTRMPLPELLITFGDRYDAAFAWCVLVRNGYTEEASIFRSKAKSILGNTVVREAYAQFFKEEMGRL